jgi:hypothetical protein
MTFKLTEIAALAGLSMAALVAIGAGASGEAAAAGAQYCIARGSANGDAAYVGNCVFSDYQQCLNAAAESHGNCVQNIDYRPDAAVSSGNTRPRRQRR